MPRDVALVIAVTDAIPSKYLGGALNSARLFKEWAEKTGYEVTFLTDEGDPVTVAGLETAIRSLLPPNAPPVHRFVLYFAGHGLIRGAEEGVWLLNDWDSGRVVVAVESLKRRLFAFDIEQIAIFSDACRELTKDAEVADATAHGVLGKGTRTVVSAPPVDKYVAAQDGEQTYMVKGDDPEDDICIFSRVLVEGLWGAAPAPQNAAQVTSQSLGAYLKKEVPVAALRYGRVLNPMVYPLFPYGDDIYLDGISARPRPALPAWPTPPPAPDSGPSVAGWSVEYIPPPPDVPPIRALPGQSASLVVRNPRRLLGQADVSCRFDGVFGELRDGSRPLGRPTAMVAELASGEFAAFSILPRFATAVVEHEGEPQLVYASFDLGSWNLEETQAALDAMSRGSLRADRTIALAAALRERKHRDPVAGVISAYLYDAIGDVDSIRQMAAYYVDADQPIPFDLALLGFMRCRDQGGFLSVEVPAVAARNPRNDAEADRAWTHAATPARQGVVAGLWPWMRQGWSYLEDADDVEQMMIRPGMVELAAEVKKPAFTTLSADGGKRLAALFGLELKWEASASVSVGSGGAEFEAGV